MFSAICCLTIALSIDCLSPGGTDTAITMHYPNIDSIRNAQESTLRSFRANHDSSQSLVGIVANYHRGLIDVYPLAFWTALYREKGISQVYLSLESWSPSHNAYEAVALFSSERKYWLAIWDGQVGLASVGARSWQVGDPVLVAYLRVPADTLAKVLGHFDSTVRPFELRQPLNCQGLTSLSQYSILSVDYCDRHNSVLLVDTRPMDLTRTEDLYDLWSNLCPMQSVEWIHKMK